jgi:hypothetical protein
MTGFDEYASETCEHWYVHYHDPDLPVYRIRRCSFCGKIDPIAMREDLVIAGWEYHEFGAEHHYLHTPVNPYKDCKGCRIAYMGLPA